VVRSSTIKIKYAENGREQKNRRRNERKKCEKMKR
jgi:hypothetical protein